MLLYHKCNKDIVQISIKLKKINRALKNITQASKATISFVPLPAGVKVNDCIQKGFVQKYAVDESPPKNDNWNIVKNVHAKKGTIGILSKK